MLAGSTRASMFSPARTWPVAKSISTQALAPVGTGGGGTGIAAACAGWPGCGVGVWAAATATRAALGGGQEDSGKAHRGENSGNGGPGSACGVRGFYVHSIR